MLSVCAIRSRLAPAVRPAVSQSPLSWKWFSTESATDSAETEVKTRKKRAKAPKGTTKQGAAISTILYKIDPALEGVIGTKQTTRADAMKLIWKYINEGDFKDPERKSFIRLTDPKLAKVASGITAQKDVMKHTEVMKVLSKHMTKSVKRGRAATTVDRLDSTLSGSLFTSTD